MEAILDHLRDTSKILVSNTSQNWEPRHSATRILYERIYEDFEPFSGAEKGAQIHDGGKLEVHAH